MDYRLVYGLVIAFLLVEVLIQHAKINKMRDYINGVFDLSEKIAEQHDRYKQAMDSMFGLYKTVKASNEEVDRHYELVQKMCATVIAAYKQKQEEM